MVGLAARRGPYTAKSKHKSKRGTETSLSVERALAFQSSLIPPYGGEIGDFVIVDNGAAVVLSVFFNGGVNTNSDSYFFGPNSFGLALMKLKLY